MYQFDWNTGLCMEKLRASDTWRQEIFYAPWILPTAGFTVASVSKPISIGYVRAYRRLDLRKELSISLLASESDTSPIVTGIKL